MRIVDVRVCQPIAENSPPDWRTDFGQILVAVDTDDGLTGYGVGGGGPAGMHVIRACLRDLLIGESADDVESLWQRMYDATLPFGRKGLAIMALSGVDLALWDLRGKRANQPLATLLGGGAGQPLPTYSTIWGDVSADDIPAHGGVKLHVGKGVGEETLASPRRLAEFIGRVREWVGPHRPFMIDAWMQWDIEFTLRMADELAPLELEWIEEPLPADDFAGYERLVRDCPISIAGGEHEFTAAGFAELIERGLHQVLQPDICWVGGMTEMVKISRQAQAAGLRVVPHRGAELWGLHAVAGLDSEPLAESGRPWMTWVGGQPEIVEGTIVCPTTPGFGVSIDENLFAAEG